MICDSVKKAAVALTLAGALAGATPTFAIELHERWVHYRNADVEVPALLVMPQGGGPYPAVLFVHGRSGLNERLQAQVRRLAAAGFAVLAPDYHTGRFIPENPIEHDPATEKDVELGLDFLKTVANVKADKVGVVGISRGGYHMGLLAVRRADVVAGIVGYYPHLANPNAPEPVQVYRYMPEVEQIKVPALLMVGERDIELRRELVKRVAERLQELGREVELVVYPGAQRAFDFRRVNRTLGDDLAREDAFNRTVRFLDRVLGARIRHGMRRDHNERPGTGTLRTIVAATTLSGVLNGAPPAAAAHARQPVALPAPMQEHMLANMRDHLAALAEIQAALAAGDSDQAAQIAERRIGMSSLERHGAAHMAPYMPKGMQDIGTTMHRAASRFAQTAREAAVEGGAPRALGALAEVTRQCVACHASYRLR